jgi:hypothetical protein
LGTQWKSQFLETKNCDFLIEKKVNLLLRGGHLSHAATQHNIINRFIVVEGMANRAKLHNLHKSQKSQRKVTKILSLNIIISPFLSSVPYSVNDLLL